MCSVITNVHVKYLICLFFWLAIIKKYKFPSRWQCFLLISWHSTSNQLKSYILPVFRTSPWSAQSTASLVQFLPVTTYSCQRHRLNLLASQDDISTSYWNLFQVSNYLQLPKTSSQSHGFTGRYLCILLKPIPGKKQIIIGSILGSKQTKMSWTNLNCSSQGS